MACGIVYEVTFKLKPLEIISFDYDVHDVPDHRRHHQESDLVQPEHRAVDGWRRRRDSDAEQGEEAEARVPGRRLGVRLELPGSYLTRIRERFGGSGVGKVKERLGSGLELGFYRLLSAAGGFTLYAPDKTINYFSKTPQSARYAFTFWAFPRAAYVKNLKDYGKWAEAHCERTGFRCNMPLGSYFSSERPELCCRIHGTATSSRSIPPYAPGANELEARATFLKAFNEWAHQRGGIPLLNQSPFVKKQHVVSAYGERWTKLADWLKTIDPNRRMVNEFFKELLP